MNSQTSLSPIEILDQLSRTGVFDHLSATEVKALRQRVPAHLSGTTHDIALAILAQSNAVLFWLPKLAGAIENPGDYLPHLERLRDISGDAFHFTEFDAEFVDVPHRIAAIRKRTLVRFVANEQPYEFMLFTGEKGVFDNYTWHYLNRVLADSGAQSRFYGLADSSSEAEPSIFNPIVFLTADQYEAISELGFVKIWRSNAWSTMQILGLIDELSGIGLFSHLSAQEIARAQRQLMRGYVNSPLAVVAAFPNLVHRFDAEMVYDPAEDYARLIQGAMGISRGVFEPHHVIVDLSSDDAHMGISFTYAGINFARKLEHRGSSDWVDFEYCRMINQALEETGTNGRLYTLETGDQTAALVFLTDSQFALIEQRSLLPLSNYQYL